MTTATVAAQAPPAPGDRRVTTPPSGTAPIRVLLVVEGCYPVSWGGVSTWCDSLMRGLPDLRFDVLAVVAQPGLPSLFEPPPNLGETITVPLWNLHEVSESWNDVSAGQLLEMRRATTDDVVGRQFVPPLRRFVRALFAPDADLQGLATDIHALHRFLVDHDLATAMRHPAVWDLLVREIRQSAPASVGETAEPRLWELTTALQWLTRWLFPLARPLPEVDVVHLAMAGVCSLVGVAAKLEHGAGFLLTEHGVYLRERYLAEASRTDSDALKTLALGFARRMTEVTYLLADQISPCCDYNQRWELRAGAAPERLETLYYGLDEQAYRPQPWPSGERPTVVWVGRINPLKDVETLLRSAALVAAERPDVRFRLYGGAQPEDAEYHQRCLDLHAELDLGDVVEFCGYTSTPAAAYAEGDVVALSSVSEGFPYSILEAMLCGRPVVATAVGGIPEQIQDTGITVEPRNPEAMATGILEMLQDPDRLRRLGGAARERASTIFTSSRFTASHRTSYFSLSPRHPAWQRSPRQRVEAARPSTVDTTREDNVPWIVEEVRARTECPVDPLEIAALIESTGVTDLTARERFGFPNTFSLAEEVFARLSPRTPVPIGGLQRDEGPTSSGDSPAASRADPVLRPLLALLPTAALLTAIYWVSTSSQWTSTQVLALVTGITTGMVCTTGIALALVRRGSALVSLGKVHALRRYIAWGALGAVGSTAVVACALSLPRWDRLEFIADNRATFLAAALILSVIWTLATCLSLVSASGWTGLALLIGVSLGLVLDRLLLPWGPHLAIAVAAAVLGAGALMVRGLQAGLAARVGGAESPDRTLPSLGFLVLEGLPYAGYGTVAVVLFFAIHVIGGLYLGYESPQLLTLEFGLFLPLAPSLLALGTAERLMHEFWLHSRALQRSLPASRPGRFGAALDARFLANTRRFLLSLVSLSLVTATVIALVALSGAAAGVAPPGQSNDLGILVTTSLVAYAIFGWAQFNGTYSLALQQWSGPLRSALAGLVVTVVSGWILIVTVGFPWLAIALALGSTVYGTGTRISARQVLADADHRYATTV